LRWLNHLIREAAVETEWLRAAPTIQTTVAGQAEYVVATNVARIRNLRVGAGDPYERISFSTLWDLDSARVQQAWGSRNLFSESYDAAGSVKNVTLFPTPIKSGDAIQAEVVLYPADISGTANSPLPADFDLPLIHGAIAIGISFGDEDNASAQFHQAIYDAGKEKLRRLANSRFSSRTASRVALKGYDFA